MSLVPDILSKLDSRGCLSASDTPDVERILRLPEDQAVTFVALRPPDVQDGAGSQGSWEQRLGRLRCLLTT